MTSTGPGVDARITELAAVQHGVVTRQQLLRAGIGRDAIRHRMGKAVLRPMHRGVYQVGPIAAPRAKLMAAALACGPEALVSHRSAAALSGLLPSADDSAAHPMDITVPMATHRRRPGIRLHRSRRIGSDEVTTIDRIPTTAPARTLLDIALVVRPRTLERALARAEREGLTTRAELLSLISRHPRHPGLGVLRTLLRQTEGPALTLSAAEDCLLDLVRKARLPAPETNVSVAGHVVDFLWREERVVVEVDGFAFHRSRGSFESDRSRDADLSARGIRALRFTWRQLVHTPEATVARLAQALASTALR